MRKLLLILLLLPVFAIGQSETHDFITYDTAFTIGGYSWIARVTRPRNMFTANHPDTASRPAFLAMGGAGEVGTNYANLRAYGPHYWLYRKSNLAIDSSTGWDGGIQLGNGKHYPIIISVQANAANPGVTKIRQMRDHLISYYRIKKGAIHHCGLSMGGFSWAALVNGQVTAGDEAGMKYVTSLTLLEGQSNGYTADLMQTDIPYSTDWSVFGHWAKKYNGKLFGLNGTNDDREIYRVQVPMNDSADGSAYFAWQNIGGGGHCCWNQMYSPFKTDWKCTGSPLGANVTIGGFPNKPNSMGTYKDGDAIFTWMLKQGDTSMVTQETPPITITKMSASEYTAAGLGSDSVVRSPKFNGTAGRVLMSALDAGGKKVIDVAPGFNTHIMLAADGTVYEGVANTTTSNQVLTDTTGAAFTNVKAIEGYYFGRIAIMSDSSVMYWGKDEYNFSGGTANFRPFKISGSLKVKKVTLGNVIQMLTYTGEVWVFTKGGGLTPVQKTLIRPAVDIAGSHHNWQVVVIPDVTGSQTMGFPYVYGTEFSFWGGSGSSTQPTSVKSLWAVTRPIKKIVMSDNKCIYIDSAGNAYAIGDSTMGELGNGKERVNKYNYSTPYQWTFTKGESYSGAPAIQIGAGTVWKNVWMGNALSYYSFMQDANDSLYSFGANKSHVLWNGYISLQEAAYRNGLDVTVPTMVSMGAFNAQPYNFTISSANAGSDKTVSGTSTTLSGMATPIQLIASGTVYNGQPNISPTVASYLWTKVSGTGGTITTPMSASTGVTGLTPGVYVYRLTATDTKGGTMSDTITVTVNADVPPSEPGHILLLRKGAKLVFKTN